MITWSIFPCFNVVQLEQCIIGGAVSEDPVSLVFSLWHVQAMVHASAVSDRVWLLGQSNGLHVMLNCPVGENGNRMFYFGWSPEAMNKLLQILFLHYLLITNVNYLQRMMWALHIEVSVLLSLTMQLYIVKFQTMQLMLKFNADNAVNVEI